MATIKDVAAMAGVSIATVSNVFNNKASTKSAAYKRVLDAAEQLGYSPNFAARNLRTGKSKLIGVILPYIEGQYGDIYSGISRIYENSDCFPVLRLSRNDPFVEQKCISDLTSMGISGLLIVPSDVKNICKVYENLSLSGTPLILLERDARELYCNKVFYNSSQSFSSELKYLKSRFDNSSISLVRLDRDFSTETEAQKIFLDICPGSDIYKVNSTRNRCFTQLLHMWSNRSVPISAIIVTTYELAIVVWEVSAILGWKPEIIAFGGNSWNIFHTNGNIRSIHRNAVGLGIKAAKILRNNLSGNTENDFQTYYIDPQPDYSVFRPHLGWKAKTIRVLGYASTGLDALEILSTELSHNSGVSFEFNKLRYKELDRQINEIIRTGHSDYDILMIDKPWQQKCSTAGLFCNLGEELLSEINVKYTSTIKRVFYENDPRRTCIPFIAGIQAIYYRKDIFENRDIKDYFWQQYGTELKIPKSWHDYNRVARFFTKAYSPDSPYKYGTAMSSVSPIGIIGEYLPRQWAFNAKLIDTAINEPILTTDGNIRALKNLCETYKYTDPSLFGSTGDTDVFNQLLSGNIPITFGFTNHYAPHETSRDSCSGLIGSSFLPRQKAMIGGYLLGISSQSKNIEICREFFRWIISDNTSISNMRMNGCIPTAAVFSNFGLLSEYPWLSLVEQSFKSGGTRETVINRHGRKIEPETIDNILSDTITQGVLTGRDTYAVLEKANKEIYDLIYNE